MGLAERKRQKRIRDYVIERDGSICCYCDRVLTMETLTMEHINPNSQGGVFNTTNLTVACAPCNSRRGSQSFFIHCKKFNWSQDKYDKYQRLHLANLKIRILNVVKEKLLTKDYLIPNLIVLEACKLININFINFNEYEKEYGFTIVFNKLCNRSDIKFCFDQLIKIIEAESR